MDWGEEPDGATPINEEQRQGLKQAWITNRDELNEAEAASILAGSEKWRRKRLSLDRLLDDKAVRDLHRDLFGEVWDWAGAYRHRDLNIGVDHWRVSTCVKNLTEDARFWFAHDSSMTVDEAGARFHHRLVWIHPFPNGNGRHARELVDLLMLAVGVEPFTWGSADLGGTSDARAAYIAALREADQGDIRALVRFVRA